MTPQNRVSNTKGEKRSRRDSRMLFALSCKLVFRFNLITESASLKWLGVLVANMTGVVGGGARQDLQQTRVLKRHRNLGAFYAAGAVSPAVALQLYRGFFRCSSTSDRILRGSGLFLCLLFCACGCLQRYLEGVKLLCSMAFRSPACLSALASLSALAPGTAQIPSCCLD